MSRANEPAFPYPVMNTSKSPQGLTVREHFAGLVLQGWMANKDRPAYLPKDDVEYCVRIADALIAELEKESK